MTPLSNYVLLTGATGLLGRYLLKDLLLSGQQVCAVVRGSSDQVASERVEAIVKEWEDELDRTLPRPVSFAADVCTEGLGLSSTAKQWLTENCRSIIHNAAVVSFDQNSNGDPARTNVGGTENILAICKECGIDDFHYVSTAYVCGFRTDRIMEADLDCGQTFRNPYEESKFRAETLVRTAEHLNQVTVYRPAVIAGDSKTGYTYTYHGIYHYLKLISLLVRNVQPDENGLRYTPIRLDMTGEESRNVIPVDWVSEVISHLFGSQEAHGRTFHLAPDTPLTPRRIIEAGYSYFNSYGVEFCGNNGAFGKPSNQMEQDYHSNMTVYKNYEQSDPEFDTSNVKQFAPHLPCPPIDEAMLHRFWKYGEEDGWGKGATTRASAS